MTDKAAKIIILSAICVLCSTGVGLAHVRHAPCARGFSIRKAGAPTPPVGLAYRPPARGGPPPAPDFTIQYGYVANPAMASGSLGAMLQGRNPAAGAIP